MRSKAGKRIYKRIAPEKWVVREIPDQRIVSDQLWASAQARTEIAKQIYGEIGSKGGMRGRSASSPYLFSELLKCSECGANITIVSGRWRGRENVVYGCPQNAYRGDTVCKNNVRVFRRPSKKSCSVVCKFRSCAPKRSSTFSTISRMLLSLPKMLSGANAFELRG